MKSKMYVERVGKRLQLCMGLRCQVQLEAMDQLGWTALLHACRNDMTEARRLTRSEASRHVNDVFPCFIHSWHPSIPCRPQSCFYMAVQMWEPNPWMVRMLPCLQLPSLNLRHSNILSVSITMCEQKTTNNIYKTMYLYKSCKSRCRVNHILN